MIGTVGPSSDTVSREASTADATAPVFARQAAPSRQPAAPSLITPITTQLKTGIAASDIRVALSKITGLAGRPKIGKGLVYSRLIADVTRGTLAGDVREPRDAIIVTTEDDPGDTLKPRLMAVAADLRRVHFFQMGSRDGPVPFWIPQDVDELSRRIHQTNAALVVVDPLIELIDGKTDAHKSQPVRQALAALNGLARERTVAIVVITHLNKGASTDPLIRYERQRSLRRELVPLKTSQSRRTIEITRSLAAELRLFDSRRRSAARLEAVEARYLGKMATETPLSAAIKGGDTVPKSWVCRESVIHDRQR